ncbi:MAG: TatD family hydrolase [Planctomycetes bacterium]|nr:TatD family hydrolase [Planctomycetota bacterium]
MRIFDPHVHMISRVTDDYEAMRLAGVEAVVEPAFWLGEPRKRVASFFDYFDHICNFEAERAAQYGVTHFCTVALNPREANNPDLVEGVLAEIPRYLDHPRAVAVGEIGFDKLTAAEEQAIRRQVEIAMKHRMPVMVHTAHRNKKEATIRNLAILKEMKADPDLVLIDHNTEETTGLVRDAGYWAGHTVYPFTKLSPERAANVLAEHGTERMMVNSSADWGPSTVMSVPKVVAELRRRGWPVEKIQTVVWNNPYNFYRQAGKFEKFGFV